MCFLMFSEGIEMEHWLKMGLFLFPLNHQKKQGFAQIQLLIRSNSLTIRSHIGPRPLNANQGLTARVKFEAAPQRIAQWKNKFMK